MSASPPALSYEPGPLTRRIFLTQQLYTLFGAPPLVYLMVLISGLQGDEATSITRTIVPPLALVIGCISPYLIIRLAVRYGLSLSPGEAPEHRMTRLLKVPGIISAGIILNTVSAAVIFTSAAVVLHGKSAWIIPWAVVALGLLVSLLMLQQRVAFEKILRPYAIADFHKASGRVSQVSSGFLWPRQSWYLPYAFALFVACTLVATASIIGRQAYVAHEFLMDRLLQGGVSPEQTIVFVRESIQMLTEGSILPVALVGAFLLVSAALAAWNLAQQQKEGTESVQRAMENLVHGKPQLPDWISTDEVGVLSATTARIFEQLKAFSFSLQSSAQSLRDCAEQLGDSTVKQTEVLTHQAAALQETQVTAQEIKHTSVLASQKAENVLQLTERANEISVQGESALQQGLTGIQQIGTQVREMATSIRALDERARQIAHITTLVKGLADRSNMLALNAAIESVRSGDAGKGFGVVAREIRTLADQSIKATRDISEILEDIGNAILSAVSLMERGSERVEVSLGQIRDFSTQVQQISNIVRENATSVRQITAAVGQQDVGIAQIFQAVSDLSKGMDQAMHQLRTSDDVLSRVRGVAEQVSGIVSRYGWQNLDEVPPPRS
ncbi:methyl-accepting chemotaxis protein [Archangium lipolyticum]|uniref:methyl-accepting chemotaxis protein n=1 Tax=Archangium lipolyticum TaxID=2970465 RepID=UPI00214A0427|nr:methyl-accepting chemotaxis protein [Archangium lipolyticum]